MAKCPRVQLNGIKISKGFYGYCGGWPSFTKIFLSLNRTKEAAQFALLAASSPLTNTKEAVKCQQEHG